MCFHSLLPSFLAQITLLVHLGALSLLSLLLLLLCICKKRQRIITHVLYSKISARGGIFENKQIPLSPRRQAMQLIFQIVVTIQVLINQNTRVHVQCCNTACTYCCLSPGYWFDGLVYIPWRTTLSACNKSGLAPGSRDRSHSACLLFLLYDLSALVNSYRTTCLASKLLAVSLLDYQPVFLSAVCLCCVCLSVSQSGSSSSFYSLNGGLCVGRCYSSKEVNIWETANCTEDILACRWRRSTKVWK